MDIERIRKVSGVVRYAAPAVVGGLVLVVCLLVADSYRTRAHADTAAPVPIANTYSQGVLAGVPLTLEVASTDATEELGLGGRTSVPDNYGMLFVFPIAADYGFWMKDMEVPIDIFWLDAQGQVITIKERVATSTYPTVFYPTSDATYVLETKAGFAAEHGVVLGAMLTGLPAENSVLK